MGKDKKPCNCKAKNDVNKLVKTIDDINLSSSKDHFKKRGFTNKILLKLLKYSIYTILIMLTIILIFPILIAIFIFSIIFKKSIKLKIPFQKVLKTN